MEKTIRITILGRTYPLRVDEADEAFTRRVAAMVDERARQVKQQAPGHPDLTHVVLTALSLGEAMLTAQERLVSVERIAEDAEALADRLESALVGPAGDGATIPPDMHDQAAAVDDAPLFRIDANLDRPAVVVPTTDEASEQDDPGEPGAETPRQQGGEKVAESASTNPKTP
jgi:cell division protein ZapA